MLALANSVAHYLDTTAALDMSVLARFHENQMNVLGATLIYSSAAANSEPFSLRDIRTDSTFSTGTTDNPCFVGVTWSTARKADHVRVYSTSAMVVNLQNLRLNGQGTPTWYAMPEIGAVAQYSLVPGWNELHLPFSINCLGVRVVYDRTQGGTAQLTFGELEVYQDLRSFTRFSGWAPGGVWVVHPDLALDDQELTAVSIRGLTDANLGAGLGIDDVLQDDAVIVGFHCPSEDSLQRHKAWATTALSLSLSLNKSGVYVAGIPLWGLDHKLELQPDGWWDSGQADWYSTPAPVVTVAGEAVTPAAIDYGRGRVQLQGVSGSAEVRADFICGVWSFEIQSFVPTGPSSPEQVRSRHNAFLLLRSSQQFQSLRESLG